jgi:hypothetical protein
VLFLALALLCGLALAGGGFIPSREDATGDLTEPTQRAILAHDGQWESLFLAVDYLGAAGSFAWVIPCPAAPKVSPADPAIFTEAGKLFSRQRSKAWERAKALAGTSTENAPREDGMTPLQRLAAGGYDATVIAARDAAGIQPWLEKNGYHVSDAVAPVLAQYVKARWCFLVLKVTVEKGQPVTLQPIRLDFASKEPIYPLRIGAANHGTSDVELYVLRTADGTARCRETNWKSSGYSLSPEAVATCPALAKSLPALREQPYEILHFHETYVPQLMARVDDLVHSGFRESDGISVALGPGGLLPNQAAVLEAFCATNMAEQSWAKGNFCFCTGLADAGLDQPRFVDPTADAKTQQEQTKVFRQHQAIDQASRRQLLGYAKVLPSLRERLLAWVADAPPRNDPNVDAALALVTVLSRIDDPAMPPLYEKAVRAQQSWTALDMLSISPQADSRRALARLTRDGQDETTRQHAMTRYLDNLAQTRPARKEQAIIVNELLVMKRRMVDNQITEHDARITAALKAIAGVDYGTEWAKWEAWVKEREK